MTKKLVYAFSGKKADGKANMKNLLGGKGANLAEMASLGIDVPPGFTVSTEACVHYFKNKNKFPPKLWDEILTHLKSLEKTCLLYTSPSPRDRTRSRMPSSA